MSDAVHVSHMFGPEVDSESRILILGSFPSVKSREASFYYAHPQNRFWKVLAAVFPEENLPSASDRRTENRDQDRSESCRTEEKLSEELMGDPADKGDLIASRKAFLHRHHIALWDVIESCSVTGSSDASIRDVVPVDLVSLLEKAPIERIYTNGKTAHRYFRKYLEPLTGRTAVCLPSTSPANAAWSLERLTEEWRRLLTPHLSLFDPGENPFYKDKDVSDGYLTFVDSAIPCIRFHSLDALSGIRASFTTRLGGVSTGSCASLNLGFSRGDRPEHLAENYRIAGRTVGADLSEIVMTDQVHGTEIRRAEKSLALGRECKPKLTGVDGLWTDAPEIALSATFADCVPVLLCDLVGRRIALVHSGWRGTAGEISGKAVEILAAEGSRPSDLVCVIGPSIDGNHYEVTGDLMPPFREHFSEEELPVFFRRKDKNHYDLDLWAAVSISLRRAGVTADHIHFSGISTYENGDILWSHRRSRGIRGNMNAFLKMDQEL